MPTTDKQLSLFTEEAMVSSESERANYGTFQDSLRAPVHRWFTYPAGFSFKAVERAFDQHHIDRGMTIIDPFAGTGTTNIVAAQRGIHSFGIEAHPFVHFVARTKLYWDFDLGALRVEIDNLVNSIQLRLREDAESVDLSAVFPELVRKCYTPEKLKILYSCREAVLALPEGHFRNFAKLCLTALLRAAADVATGWPYIAPQKAKKGAATKPNFNLLNAFHTALYQMREDVRLIRPPQGAGKTIILHGDSRQIQPTLTSSSIDFAFTSPPYLNNFDYADRTRLELYFWGEAFTWADISRNVRDRLMMSATTQVNRRNYQDDRLLSADLSTHAPKVAHDLLPKIEALSKLRLTKGGKKSYDILVAGYFNDMFRVIGELSRVLKPSATVMMILGDSAPYGVYIPTHTYLGEIGRVIGFSDYRVETLRARGDKWKANPQRHRIALQECILTLTR